MLMSYVRRVSRIGLAAAMGLTLAASFAPAASAASGTTRWVAKDGHAGPNSCGGGAHASKVVQDAVNLSGPNDVILVCPGTYRGTVLITGDRAGLTIRGTNPWKATLSPEKNSPTVAGELDLISIDQVNDVTIRGLRIAAPNETNCATVDVGISVLGSTGARITRNHLSASANSAGCGIHTGIMVRSKAPPPAGTDTIPASARVSHNLVTNFQNWGIAAGYDANVDVQFTDNVLHYYLRTVVSAAASGPASVAPAGTGLTAGIFLGGAVNAVVSSNAIESAEGVSLIPVGGDQARTLSTGIRAEEAVGTVVISDNFIRRVFTGLYVQAIGFTVDDNVVRKSYIGLETSHGGGVNRFRRNTFDGIANGILADNASGANTFRHNTSHASDGNACEDQSTGTGTGGTANTWIGNTGNTSSPSEICPSEPN
jgi:hypothetical protein